MSGSALMDYAELRKIRASVDRGRLLTAAQADWLRGCACAKSDIDGVFEHATANAALRVGSATRLNGDNLAALETFAPEVAEAHKKRLAQRKERTGLQAKTSAERKSEFLDRKNNIGAIPDVVDLVRRDECRFDLAKFGATYCSDLLMHAPSDHMLQFVEAIQGALLDGGKVHVRWPRGKGKTTWIKIASLWALSYGHRRYMVVVAATGPRAQRILADLYRIIRFGEAYYEDFPEIAYPIRLLNDVAQRAVNQHVNGRKTNCILPGNRIRLPDIEGSAAAGSVAVAYGCGGSVRGESEGSLRPDMVLIDDAQKRSDAKSAARTEVFENFVIQDLYGLAGHDKQISVLMASTPVAPSDGSNRFADPERHPEMQLVEIPLIISMPNRMDLWDEFSELYRQDLIAHRDDRSLPWLSREFYDSHRDEMDAGAETIDPADGDPASESSALHHAMILRTQMGGDAFDAEYQMCVRRAESTIELTPEFVANRLSNVPKYQIPIVCRECVGFIDVNARADIGLRWGIVAVGRGNAATCIAYGRYPADGTRLYPEHATETDIDNAIARGLAFLANYIAGLPIARGGKRKSLYALCIDGGWRTATVSAFCASVRAPFKVIWAKGFGWRSYYPNNKIARPGNHCHLGEAGYGTFLAIHADYWREYMQRSLLAEPLQPGSLSLFGSDARVHATMANEVCAEVLVDTGVTDAGRRIWTWQKRQAENHYGDVLSGCLAVAGWFRLLEPPEAVTASAAADVLRGSVTPETAPAVRPRSIRTAPARRQKFRFSFRNGR